MYIIIYNVYMKDFRKFATSKMGINGMVLDDIVSMQNQYMNPYILEERQLNVDFRHNANRNHSHYYI